jgi:hypothetical protein
LKISFFTLLLISLFYLDSFSQVIDSARRTYSFETRIRDYKQLELVAGYSVQGNLKNEVKNLHYVEIGVARSIQDRGYHGGATFGMLLTEEILIGENENVYGTKIGMFTHYMIDIGFSMVYYTDFKKGNFKFRPEIGMGMGGVRFIVGFNIPFIDNSAFELLRKNNVQAGIQIMIPVRKKLLENRRGIFQELFSK